MLIVRVSCIFRPLGIGEVTEALGIVPVLKFELCRMCFFRTVFRDVFGLGRVSESVLCVSVVVRLCPNPFGGVLFCFVLLARRFGTFVMLTEL